MENIDCPPVLFVIFNRPDLTRRVFKEIQIASPGKLFIAADGPRNDRIGEKELCSATRAITQDIDWECEVQTLFSDQNNGCKLAVSQAISWFFQHVEEGIILEDDCLPDQTFFRYCSELLTYYREDSQVMMISGDNFQRNFCGYDKSYYFSIYNHIWGWATWRRAWQKYDGSLETWPKIKDTNWLKDYLNNKVASDYWEERFERSYRGDIDSWAYPWAYSCWRNNGLIILPSVNLVNNIGFDHRGTHLKSPMIYRGDEQAESMRFPLQHDNSRDVNKIADRYTFITHYLKRKYSLFIPVYLILKLFNCFTKKT